MTDPPFRTGDRVRLKTGKSTIQVMEVDYFECSNKDNCPPKIKKGKRPRKGWYIRFAYESSLRCTDYSGESYGSYDSRTWREADDFVHLDPQPEKEPEMSQPVIALYETKDGKFGTKCGENSEGKWIIEIKGAGGQVKAYDKEDLTEVVPYTVELMRLNAERGVQPEKRHYRAEKDSVKTGDVLMQLTTSALWRVVAVDTKCRTAQSSKNGFARLLTEAVKVGQE